MYTTVSSFINDLSYTVFSDALFRDVMSNQEVVEMVTEAINKNGESPFQVAAEWLTQEAYIRGSADNIGVCVVAIMYGEFCTCHHFIDCIYSYYKLNDL